MSMSDVILRLISGWYDPVDADNREHRTSVARSNAIAVRKRSEPIVERVIFVHRSYRRADALFRSWKKEC